jgi:oligoribonuclease (3'-5' exoribonuclease)
MEETNNETNETNELAESIEFSEQQENDILEFLAKWLEAQKKCSG